MWKTRHLPLIIDLLFCGVLLPVMLKLLPIERWIVNDSTFVYLLAGWLYVVYLLNRAWILPSLLRRRRVHGRPHGSDPQHTWLPSDIRDARMRDWCQIPTYRHP